MITLENLVSRITNSLTNTCDFEVILVDDGSLDNSWLEILRISKSDGRVNGIRLGKNFGQHSALVAGIRSARFPVVITIDDDLQNPPEGIPKLLAALTPDVDVVYGVSTTVKQNLWRRLGSRWVRQFLSFTLGFRGAVSMSSFRAFRTHLRDGFNTSLGPNISLDALLTWSTSRFANVEVDHRDRAEGTSHYTLRKLIRFMIDMATGYSALPLRLATAAGFVTITFGIGLLTWVIGRPFITGESVPGFPLLASSLAIFSGTQLLVLGVLGEYIGRMHFRVMNKPTYTIAETTARSTE